MSQEGSSVNLTSSGLSNGNVKPIESVPLLLTDTRSGPVCITIFKPRKKVGLKSWIKKKKSRIKSWIKIKVG